MSAGSAMAPSKRLEELIKAATTVELEDALAAAGGTGHVLVY
jgi:hypothetical protein